MSLIEDIQILKKLPFSDDYESEKAEAEFLELSYEANGSEYTRGTCPEGKIVVKLPCEEYTDYESRVQLTPTRSYVSSIISKYNASIFRNEPSRSTENATYDLLYKDADGYGNSLNKVMKEALKKSQIDGSCYLLADSSASDTEILTIAQQSALGVRPYIRIVPKDSVINYTEVEEKLLEAIILLEDAEGNEFARYMNDEVFVDITLGRDYMVTEISEPYSHNYPGIPLVEIEPFEVAQSKPISYSQRTIVNLLSLLNQEMTDHVFSKFLLSGVRLPEEDNNAPRITYGSKRMIVLEDQGANLQVIGADHGAAESLRNQIKLEEDNLYYSAGFGNQNVEPTNMSGFALSILKDDFFINCNDLKTAIENAENSIMELIASKEGFDYIPVIYSNRFIADDGGTALASLRDLLALPLPQTFKNLAIKDYIEKFYNVSDEQKQLIETELNSNSQQQI